MQPGAGVLLFDGVGGHRLHLPGHGVITSIVCAHGIECAVGITVGDLITIERHPHQIVKAVLGDSRVVRGHQIQEVSPIHGVIVVNTDTDVYKRQSLLYRLRFPP